MGYGRDKLGRAKSWGRGTVPGKALPITALIILAPFLTDAQAQRPPQRDMKAEFTHSLLPSSPSHRHIL